MNNHEAMLRGILKDVKASDDNSAASHGSHHPHLHFSSLLAPFVVPFTLFIPVLVLTLPIKHKLQCVLTQLSLNMKLARNRGVSASSSLLSSRQL